MKISILGSGYVGLVAGVCFSEAGHQVTCFDSNQLKINQLNSGLLPFYEPGLQELFDKNQSKMRFSDHIDASTTDAEVVFLAIGTPEGPDGNADITDLTIAFEKLCALAQHNMIVVIKSTVPVGTAALFRSKALELTKHKIEIVSNPEFLRQGSAVNDFLHPDRIILGTSDALALAVLKQIYLPIVDNKLEKIIAMDSTSAEMTKYAANSFLALKISYINELSLLAKQLGADIEKVKQGFTSDHRINPHFFNPGIGYGGSCFPKDIRALLQTGYKHNIELMLLQACEAVNDRQQAVFFKLLRNKIGSASGKTIGVWGLSFKASTDDVRRSMALDVIAELTSSGAKVKAYDPVAGTNAQNTSACKFELCESPWSAIENADALVIMTDWPEFKSADLKQIAKKLNRPLVIDGRNLFNATDMENAGIDYFTLTKS
jgi:UDPglucose 6-dehydrogenase